MGKAQENVKTIRDLMQRWKDDPMFVRCDDSKSEGLLNVRDMPEKKRGRYEVIEKAGQKITSLVRDCQRYFNAPEQSEDWRR